MNLRESVGIALGALRANKLRSFLTLLGTIIGVMSVIAVVSFVEGLNRYVSEKLLAAGANVFQVDKFGLITSQEAWEDAMKRPDITPDDADALRMGMRYAALVVPQAGHQATARYKSKAMKNVAVRGRGPGYEVIDDLTIDSGRHISDFDDQRRRLVCVIGPEVAEELFPGLDAIGRNIRIADQMFQVIGVTQAKGKVLGQSQDRFATIPIRTFLKYMQERESIEIAVKSVDQASLPLAQQEA